MWTENGIDLGKMSGWSIRPDIEFSDNEKAFAKIENEIDTLLRRKSQVITLGEITQSHCRLYDRMRKHTEN